MGLIKNIIFNSRRSLHIVLCVIVDLKKKTTFALCSKIHFIEKETYYATGNPRIHTHNLHVSDVTVLYTFLSCYLAFSLLQHYRHIQDCMYAHPISASLQFSLPQSMRSSHKYFMGWVADSSFVLEPNFYASKNTQPRSFFPEIITGIFHRGILGTALYLLL